MVNGEAALRPALTANGVGEPVLLYRRENGPLKMRDSTFKSPTPRFATLTITSRRLPIWTLPKLTEVGLTETIGLLPGRLPAGAEYMHRQRVSNSPESLQDSSVG